MTESETKLIEFEELTEAGPVLRRKPASEITPAEFKLAMAYLDRKIEVGYDELARRRERISDLAEKVLAG